MSIFEQRVDDLAKKTIAGQDHPQAGYPAGVTAMANAIKAAALDGTFRVDHDMPSEMDAYVIRIEADDGRRLRTVMPLSKVPADANVLLGSLRVAAGGLIATMLVAQGRQLDGVENHSPIVRPG